MFYAHKRPETLNVASEYSDDIPLLIAHMRRAGIPQTLDRHIPTHAYWGNLSAGWTAAIWLAHLLSCSDHKPRTVQQWVSIHSETLRWCAGSTVTPVDLGVDRLYDVLIGLSHDDHWLSIEADLNRHMLRAWSLPVEQVHLRLYEGRSWHISPNGSFQISLAHPWRARTLRPSILLATLLPSNVPLVTWSFSSDHSSSVSFTSILESIACMLPQQRHRFVGDALTSVDLRGAVHMRNDEYLFLLPDASVDPAYLLAGRFPGGASTLFSARQGSHDDLLAEDGIEWYVPMSVEIDGLTITWNERRIAARSPVQAHLLEEALRTRMARAEAALLALVQRKRGKRRPRSLDDLREAAHAILDSYQVHGLLRLDFAEQIEERVVRRYRGRPTGVRVERDVHLTVSTDTDALAQAIQRLAWQMLGSNIPHHNLPADRALSMATLPVSGFERLHGRPLSLAPHEVHTPELEIGLVRLLALGLRTLVLLETIARLQLIKEGLLPAIDDERAASRTTSERLLDAFRDIMLLPGAQRLPRTVTPLSPLQQRVLHLLSLSPEIYQATR
jgi:transposase